MGLGVLQWDLLGVLRQDPTGLGVVWAKSDHPLQFFGSFRTLCKLLANLLDIFIFNQSLYGFSKMFQLEGGVRVCFSKCLSFACFFQAELIYMFQLEGEH
jgi:hypothetical protein